jgi:hypothetical protein
MISQSPRIYLYKITFEEVPYYYYGVHKEKKYNEYYMGSPVTNKWCWDFYTPKKQILEIFDYIDEGWIEAQKVEKRLIKPVYNTDKWCLNESCGGIYSIEQKRKAGKIGGSIGGKKTKEMGVGVFGMTANQKSNAGKVGSQKAKELGVGIFAITSEEKREIGKKTQELGIGIFSQSKEQLSENGKKAAETNKQNQTSIFSLTKEQLSENGKKGGKSVTLETRKKSQETHKKNGTGFYNLDMEERMRRSKKGGERAAEMGVGIHSLTYEQKQKLGEKTSSQRWKCLVTGHISTPGGLTPYQKARGIDTSKRVRIS